MSDAAEDTGPTVRRRKWCESKALELLGALQPVRRQEAQPVEVGQGEFFVHIEQCPHYNTCLHQAGLRDWEQITCHHCGIYTVAVAELIKYLKDGKLPDGLEPDPGLQADVDCLKAELAVARERIKELETDMPRKATPEKQIKAWLLAQQDYTYLAIGEKLDCNNDTASRWVQAVEDDPELLKRAKAQLNSKGEPKQLPGAGKANTVRKKKADTQQAEIDYLRWCLEGERNGYVERLLEELGK